MDEKIKLADALAKAQGEIKGAIANKQNAYLKNKYADLSSVFEACREAFEKYGIAITQVFETLEDGTLFLRTSLMKGSERIDSRLPIQWVKDWHSMGSAVSYARRYSLSAIAGICTDSEDDDGVKAMGMDSSKSTPKHSPNLPRRDPLLLLQERAYKIIEQVPHAEDFILDATKDGETDVLRLPEPICKRVVGYEVKGMKEKVEEWLKKKTKEVI